MKKEVLLRRQRTIELTKQLNSAPSQHLVDKIAYLESKNRELKEQLQREGQEFARKLDALEQELMLKTEQNKNFERVRIELNDQVQKLEIKLKQKNQECVQIDAEFKRYKDSMFPSTLDLQRQVDLKNNEIDRMKQEIVNVVKLRKEIFDEQTRNEVQTVEIRSLKATIEDLEQQLWQLKNEPHFNELDAEPDRVERQVQRLIQEVEESKVIIEQMKFEQEYKLSEQADTFISQIK